MMSHGTAHSLVVESGWAGVALEGVSGDLHLVERFEDGALLAVLDGLGHGPDAAAASLAAAEILSRHAADSVTSLMQRCHQGLRHTRGVVMNLASFHASDSTVSWVGVGNVDGVLLRADRSVGRPRETIIPRGGVVGHQLPSLRETTHRVAPGDTLVMATDGIRGGFTSALDTSRGPQELAESVLAGFRKGHDDALVMVVRFVMKTSAADAIRVPIREDADIAIARKIVREIGREGGLGDAAVEELATAVSEIARNILVHAREGEVVAAHFKRMGRRVVEVVASDRGPGIPDIAAAMRDGYSTRSGLGLGLPSARRLVDDFEVTSGAGKGTTVTMRKWAA